MLPITSTLGVVGAAGDQRVEVVLGAAAPSAIVASPASTPAPTIDQSRVAESAQFVDVGGEVGAVEAADADVDDAAIAAASGRSVGTVTAGSRRSSTVRVEGESGVVGRHDRNPKPTRTQTLDRRWLITIGHRIANIRLAIQHETN